MNDLNTKEVSDICVSCGMCCDGTLFKNGSIKNEEDLNNIKTKGIETAYVRDKWVFKQPCVQFEGSCKIYGQERPHVCNNYFCEPLKKYGRNEQTLEMANSQINKLLYLKREILQASKEFSEFDNFLINDIVQIMDPIMEKSEPSDLKKYGKLILLTVNFREAKKQINTKVGKKLE